MRKFIIIIIVVMLLFNGLANQREINKLAIVSCIGLDITEDGKFNVTVNELNTQKSSSGSSGESEKGKSQANIYEATENSIQEALRNIIKQSSKRISLSHIKLLMLSEEVIKEKEIMDVIDFFIRDYEGGNNFTLVVTKDKKPKELIENLSKSSSDFAMDIRDSIEITNKYKGVCTNDVLNNNLRNLLKEGGALVINSIEMMSLEDKQSKSSEDKSDSKDSEQSQEQPKVLISDMVYFKDNKMGGYLEKDDNLTHNLLKNRLEKFIIELGKDDNRIVIEAINSNVSLKPEIVGGEYIVNIDVSIVGNITETGKNIKISDKKELEQIEKNTIDEIEQNIRDYVDNCKYKYGVDLVEFGNLFYKYKYKEYEQVKEKFYDEIYDNIKININSKVDIKNHGGVKKSW